MYQEIIKQQKQQKKKQHLNVELLLKYEKENKTLAEIGEIHNVTRERIRQIYLQILGRPKLIKVKKIKITKNLTCKHCGLTKEVKRNHLSLFCNKKCREEYYDLNIKKISNKEFLEGIKRYGSIKKYYENQNISNSKGSFYQKWFRLKRTGLVPKEVMDRVLSNKGRKQKLINFQGKNLNITQWSKELGISNMTLNYRLRKWPIEKALTEKNNGLS